METEQKTIHSNLNLKETPELINIWAEQNKNEWTDLALEVVKQILLERLGELPEIPQTSIPIKNQEENIEKLITENPPEFYDPLQVCRLEKSLTIASQIMIGIIVIYSILNYKNTYNLVWSYFMEDSVMVSAISIFVVFINILIVICIIYFPMKAFGKILRLLMQIEYNSRRP